MTAIMSAEADAEFLKQFSAAVERKGAANGACPVCDGTHWIVDPRPVVLHHATDRDLNTADLQRNDAIANVCATCGLMRFHLRAVLFDEPDTTAIAPTHSNDATP